MCYSISQETLAVYYELLRVALESQNMRAVMFFTGAISDIELHKDYIRRNI